VEHRWTLFDPTTDESWEMQINPNQMSTPHAPDGTQIFTRSATRPSAGSVARVLVGKLQPHDWSFTGVVREEAHFHELHMWSRKRQQVHLTDHFDRTWRIRILSIDLTERKPTPRRNWRYEYTVKTLLYGQVSP
jgi:hypothetical protein